MKFFHESWGHQQLKKHGTCCRRNFKGSKKIRTIKLQYFRRDFENLKMKDNENAKEYYSRIKELLNQMSAYEEKIDGKKIVEM